MVLMTVGFGLLAPPVGLNSICRQRHGQDGTSGKLPQLCDAVLINAAHHAAAVFQVFHCGWSKYISDVGTETGMG
jgi:hypothetical protein